MADAGRWAYGAAQLINERLLALNLHNTRVEVSQVDSQPSADHGVIVMVLGKLIHPQQPERRFAQTFFLAADGDRKFFVLNDIFRYLKEGEDAAPPARAATEGATGTTAAPAPAPTANVHAVAQAHTQAPSAPTATTKAAAPAAPVPTAAPITTATTATTTTAAAAAAKPVTITATVPAAQPATGGARARPWGGAGTRGAWNTASAGEKAAGTTATPSTVAPTTTAAATTAPTAAATTAALTPAASTTTSGAGEARPPRTNQRPLPADRAIPSPAVLACSIHIGRIQDMSQITEASLKTTFAPYGEVRKCMINEQKYFANVEFDSKEIVAEILKVRTFRVGEVTVYAEQRQAFPARPPLYMRRENGLAAGGGPGSYRPRPDGPREYAPRRAGDDAGGERRGPPPGQAVGGSDDRAPQRRSPRPPRDDRGPRPPREDRGPRPPRPAAATEAVAVAVAN
jgi:hypothetical protein